MLVMCDYEFSCEKWYNSLLSCPFLGLLSHFTVFSPVSCVTGASCFDHGMKIHNQTKI